MNNWLPLKDLVSSTNKLVAFSWLYIFVRLTYLRRTPHLSSPVMMTVYLDHTTTICWPIFSVSSHQSNIQACRLELYNTCIVTVLASQAVSWIYQKNRCLTMMHHTPSRRMLHLSSVRRNSGLKLTNSFPCHWRNFPPFMTQRFPAYKSIF